MIRCPIYNLTGQTIPQGKLVKITQWPGHDEVLVVEGLSSPDDHRVPVVAHPMKRELAERYLEKINGKTVRDSQHGGSELAEEVRGQAE